MNQGHTETSTTWRSFRHVANVLRMTPSVLRLVWRAFPAGAVLVPVITLALAPMPVAYLYCLKRIVDVIALGARANHSRAWPDIMPWFAVLAIVGVGQWALEYMRRFLEHTVQKRLEQSITHDVLAKAAELDVSFFEQPEFHDKLQRAETEVGFRPFAVMSALMRGLQHLSFVAAYALLLATLAWWVMPAMLALALPLFIIGIRFGHMGFWISANRTPHRRQMEYYQSVLTSVRDAKELRLFGLCGHFLNRWRQAAWRFYHEDQKLLAREHRCELAGMIFRTIGVFGLYAFVLQRTISGEGVTIGSLLMYILAIDQTMLSIEGLLLALGGLYENNLYMQHLSAFLNEKPRLVAPNQCQAVPRPFRSVIRFNNVTFRYPGEDQDVLRGMSFELRPGEKVALVGDNGAGKTTVVKLLTRLYDPQQGSITVDDIDLRRFDPQEWRAQLGVIFQDYARYAVTARENIGFGRVEWLDDMSRIIEAARMAGADECIRRLPAGWNSVLGKIFEGGHELSVGEWQKIALARAFFRDSQLLVLDEPTAALDAKQEFRLFQQFRELSADKTTLFISHRFSSVRSADRILVMEHGRVAESGPHEALVALKGKYAEMFSLQASAYLSP